MDTTVFLGHLAAFLTTTSFVPQAVRIIRTKDTRSISLPMYLILIAGLIVWTIYGVLSNLLPVILCNAVTLVFTTIILFYKLRETIKKKTNTI